MFTAHLLHSLQAESIARIGKRSETKLRQFGYGLHYQNVSINDILDCTERPFFITIFKENYLPVIIRLNDEDPFHLDHWMINVKYGKVI